MSTRSDLLAMAARLDGDDPLNQTRSFFPSHDPNLIYLDGNSLGRLHADTPKILDEQVNSRWGRQLIRSWNEDWYDKSVALGDKIAPIAGAAAGEVVVTDTTSVNLYKLAYAALRHNTGRTKIITDNLNFPSDMYILQGLVDQFGDAYSLHIIESTDGIGVTMEQLEAALDENTALVSLSHVIFKSSFKYNMKAVTERVHKSGAMMLWDLSHSIGAVPGELNAAHADLAVGCSYKYLNGGPGSPAFLYIRKDLQDKLQSPVWGWFGQNNPFDFSLDYKPAEGIRRFLAGTPPILSMAAMEPTLDLMNEIGLAKIRTKSVKLSSFFLEQAMQLLFPLGFSTGSPVNAEDRGSHVSLRHPEAYRICKALIDPGVGSEVIIPDFRSPDNIRFGFTPLYTTFTELVKSILQLWDIIEKKWYTRFDTERENVT